VVCCHCTTAASPCELLDTADFHVEAAAAARLPQEVSTHCQQSSGNHLSNEITAAVLLLLQQKSNTKLCCEVFVSGTFTAIVSAM
jgi:hypothetical protein